MRRTRPRPPAPHPASPLPARPGVAQDLSRRWVGLAYTAVGLAMLALIVPYKVGVADTFVHSIGFFIFCV
jgi:hypothetical protein